MSFVIVAPELMEAGHRTCPAARSHSPRSPDQLRTGQLPNSRLDSAHSVRFPILAADRPGTRCLKTRCWKSAEQQNRAKQRELRIGDVDRAVEKSRIVFNYLLDTGGMLFRGSAITVLVEALLARGGKGDFPEAQDTIGQLEAARTEPGFVLHELPMLRLPALPARVQGDDAAYKDFRDRYRAMAKSLGFVGHIAWAEAMP